MAQIGMEHLRHVVNGRNALQRRLDGIKDRLAGTTEKLIRTGTVVAAAAASGVIQGKAGPEGAHIFHVPVDLGAGIVLNLLGYFRAAGKQSHHLINAGDGFLAGFSSNLGFSWGNKWRTSGSLFGSPGQSALPSPGAPVASKGEVSAAQMADIVARVRVWPPVYGQSGRREGLDEEAKGGRDR